MSIKSLSLFTFHDKTSYAMANESLRLFTFHDKTSCAMTSESLSVLLSLTKGAVL